MPLLATTALAFSLPEILLQKKHLHWHPRCFPEPESPFTPTQFPDSEKQKFRAELFERLSEDKDEVGDDLHAVVDVCAQELVQFTNAPTFFSCNVNKNITEYLIPSTMGRSSLLSGGLVHSKKAKTRFSELLHKEYGGPGTLLVEPFTDTLIALKKKKLPGAPLAARTSVLWAQNYVHDDWQVWNSKL